MNTYNHLIAHFINLSYLARGGDFTRNVQEVTVKYSHIDQQTVRHQILDCLYHAVFRLKATHLRLNTINLSYLARGGDFTRNVQEVTVKYSHIDQQTVRHQILDCLYHAVFRLKATHLRLNTITRANA